VLCNDIVWQLLSLGLGFGFGQAAGAGSCWYEAGVFETLHRLLLAKLHAPICGTGRGVDGHVIRLCGGSCDVTCLT
jgi:hypothetical protein